MFTPHSTPVLGIDVSKKELVSVLVEPVTEKTRWTRSLPNTPEGVQQLLQATPADVPWVVEPTGRYSDLVVELGRAAQREVLMAQPQRARYFLRSLDARVKSDKVDGRGLGVYGLNRPLRPFPQKSKLLSQLDQLRAARKGLARSIQRLTLQVQALPSAAAGLQVAITALEAQRDAFDAQIAALVADAAQFPAVPKLQQVSGIGPVTAAAVVSCLTAKQFETSDAFVAYIGLAVQVRQSGQWAGKAKLAKQGDAELRRLLYLCAQSTLRRADSPFRIQYDRERAKGLSSTAALCAVARKLARLCWSLWKYQTDYDPARVHQQPPKPSRRAPADPKSAVDAPATPPAEPRPGDAPLV
jgi:transposase